MLNPPPFAYTQTSKEARMGRIVFLDIDGVLASQASYNRYKSTFAPVGVNPQMDHRYLDRYCTQRVQTLCDVAGASIVVSSDWRLGYDTDDLIGMLREAGLTAEVKGITPSGGSREAEVRSWMNDHGLDDDAVVILEDARDMGHLKWRQVQPLYAVGFTESDLVDALSLWGLDIPESPGHKLP